ncbi:MAG: hypothetical protein IJD69_02030 [Alphaproteobacteria bacterium]|nr:hypothetical protein [Alphaproteobacteria bacterium]
MKINFVFGGIVALALIQSALGAATDITTCTNKQQSCGTNKYCTKYGYCYPECDAPITMEYGWSSSGTGVEKRTTWCLYEGQDVSETQYRCIAGYYGTDGNCTICPAGSYCPLGSTEAVPCPSAKFDTSATGGTGGIIAAGAMGGPTSNQGASEIEDCYIPANNYYRHKDEYGVYVWDTDCHYGCDCYVTE